MNRQAPVVPAPPRKGTPADFAGVCGLYWEGSAWYETLEVTCGTQGQVDLGKVCPVYACARERQVAHCGICPDFPCLLLVQLAAQTGGGDLRIESAARRAHLGEAAWANWAREQKMWLTHFCPLRTLPLHHPEDRTPSTAR